MRTIASLMVIFGLPLAWTGRVDEASPTQEKGVRLLTSSYEPIDDNLKAWFDRVEASRTLKDISEAEFGTLLSGLGPASQAYLKWKKFGGKPSDIFTSDYLDNFEKSLDLNKEPLAGDFLLQLAKSADQSEIAKIDLLLESKLSNSCAWSERLLQRIDHVSLPISEAQFERLSTDIESFARVDYKLKAWRRLISRMPANQRSDGSFFLGQLRRYTQQYPSLEKDFEWLRDRNGLSPEKLMEESFERLFSRRQCQTARDRFIASLSKSSSLSIELAQGLTEKVDQCYRSRSRTSRLQTWKLLERALEARFGFPGLELVKRTEGLSYWGRDEFAKAKAIFDQLIEQAQVRAFTEIEARSLFTRARIAENEGELGEAIKFFQDFYRRFPEHEKTSEALSYLIVLYSVKNQDRLSQPYVDALSKLAIDSEDEGMASFALFWAAKQDLRTGDIKPAITKLERLVTSYYSSFYGALAHFLLEDITGHKFRIGPSNLARFDLASFEASFEKKDRILLNRLKTLQAFGLRKEARCVLSELTARSDSHQQQYYLALAYYANHDWLDSIRAYASLPRSYRDSLPAGSERILFPRRYSDLVSTYSAQLGVDENLIHSIIRQESVYNPKARSAVGARGLMQLMPATARGEGRLLTRGYLEKSERLSLMKASRSRRALHDEKVNLALGVHHVHRLLSRYQHPVFALSSYNANPRATSRWRENISSTNILTFVERIPYKETRSYVKLVMRNYFYYNRWYGGASRSMPLMEELMPPLPTVAKSDDGMKEVLFQQ